MSPTGTVVLVHSPLVGPASWRALAPLLEARGCRVIVPDFRSALLARPPLYFRIGDAITEEIARASRGNDIALVVHSGAGALAPLLARTNSGVRHAVFLDALLPHPGKSWFDTAPAELTRHLKSSAKGSRLPRWHRWWPRGAMAELVPDESLRAAFIAELHEVPVAYLEEAAPLGNVPAGAACAYLQLSPGCKPDADEAERRGWPVRRLDLDHLAMLTRADEVEAALIELLATSGARKHQ